MVLEYDLLYFIYDNILGKILEIFRNKIITLNFSLNKTK
jgi:hypothetical protein